MATPPAHNPLDLIVVSNREPYIHCRVSGRIKVLRPAGGLTSALESVLSATGGLWVAWGSGNADWETVDGSGCVDVPSDRPSYRLKRVRLSRKDAVDYYDGFANQALWPLFHGEVDRVMTVGRFWEAYQQVNDCFCRAIEEVTTASSIVWLHDYHLCLVPSLLRKHFPRQTIAHFWHIPWPSWEVFRLLAQGEQLLAGLLGNDLIGFQIPLFANNFMVCARECLDAEVDFQEMTIAWQGQTTRVRSFPISIDYARKAQLAAADETQQLMAKLRRRYHLPPLVGLGVDRLDYTKGLVQRLQAVELFFERYRQFRGKFSLVQISVPTRKGPGYDAYAREVEARIERVNARYGTDTWRPVVYIKTKQDERDLAAWYRLADLALVSPVCDGMNLVAKEYAASQGDRPGVLILSRFAGAAAELSDALLVNPSDIDEMKTAIHSALTMPVAEKNRRIASMQGHLAVHDIHGWFQSIRHDLLALARIKQERGRWVFAAVNELRNRFAAQRPFFCFDFDGTLAPIVMHPEMAFLTPEVEHSLTRLSQQAHVMVISGRSLDDLRKRCRIPGCWLAGNHGAELWDGSRVICSGGTTESARQLRLFLTEITKVMASFTGVLVEDKGVSASVHYRMVPPALLESFREQFAAVAARYEEELRVTTGKKVFEIRPRDAWNKGDAVTWLAGGPCDGMLPVCMGDDTTDADAFRAVADTGVSISVGGQFPTDYYLAGQEEVPRLLQLLLTMVPVR